MFCEPAGDALALCNAVASPCGLGCLSTPKSRVPLLGALLRCACNSFVHAVVMCIPCKHMPCFFHQSKCMPEWPGHVLDCLSCTASTKVHARVAWPCSRPCLPNGLQGAGRSGRTGIGHELVCPSAAAPAGGQQVRRVGCTPCRCV